MYVTWDVLIQFVGMLAAVITSVIAVLTFAFMFIYKKK